MDLNTIRASVDALTERVTASVTKVEDGLKSANDSIEKLQAQGKRPGGAAANDKSPGDLKAEHKAVSAFVRTGDESGLKSIHAAHSVGSDPDGGYMVQPAMSTGMTRKLYDDVTLRRLARVVSIDSGSEWLEPIDQDESGASWTHEQATRSETDSAELKMLRIPLDEIYAMTRVSQKLVDDASFDIGGFIDAKQTEKFGRSENEAFVNGNGVGKPRGFLTYDTATTADDARAWGTLQHTVSGSATEVTLDGLIDLFWSLRAPYRRNATWVMSSNTASIIDKIRDGDGRPIWRNALVAGDPPTLLGKKVEFEEEMPTVEAGALAIAFADWKSAYAIIDRPGIRQLRDPYTLKGQILHYSYRRVGGGLANSEALKLQKIAAS